MRALSVAAAFVAAAVPCWVLGVYLPSFNTNRTPIADAPAVRATPPPGAPPIAQSVTVVVIDGLSFDRAREAQSFRPLFEAGAARVLEAPFPSYTYPCVTALLTGVPPRESGVRLNGDIVGPNLDSIARAAEDAGLAVRVRSRGWSPFHDIARLGPGADVRLGRAAHAVETTLRLFTGSRPGRALELVYLGDPDEAAHEHDEDSPELAAAVETAGLIVARRLCTLDPARDAIVVVSDHGHRRGRGGHGGVEREVVRALFLAIGPGIVRGATLDARPSQDVAATVALLGGFPAPASSLGRPMLDLLETPERAARGLARDLEALARRACPPDDSACTEGAADLARRLERGDPAAVTGADEAAARLIEDRERRIAADCEASRRRRLGLAGGALAIGAVGTAGLGFRRRIGARPNAGRRLAASLAWPIVLVGIYAIAMGIRGYRVSFSTLPPMGIFLRDSFLAGGGALLVTLMAAYWRKAAGERLGWVMLCTVAVPYALVAAWVGADPRFVVPPIEGALVFFLAPIVEIAALASVALALLPSSTSADMDA